MSLSNIPVNLLSGVTAPALQLVRPRARGTVYSIHIETFLVCLRPFLNEFITPELMAFCCNPSIAYTYIYSYQYAVRIYTLKNLYTNSDRSLLTAKNLRLWLLRSSWMTLNSLFQNACVFGAHHRKNEDICMQSATEM